MQAGRDGGAHGKFAVQIGGGEAGRAAFYQEASQAVGRTRPDDGDISNGTIGNPGFLAV